MRTGNTPETFGAEPRMASPAESARIVQDARRVRAEAQAELLRSAGRGIARHPPSGGGPEGATRDLAS
jgi:hypothetical protein